MMQHLPVLSVVFVLITAYLLPLVNPRYKIVGQVATILILAGTAIASFYFVALTATGEVIIYEVGGWQAPFGITIAINSLTAIVMSVVSVVTLLAYFYRLSDPTVPQGQAGSLYDALLLLLVASVFGITQCNDLFNLFVFIEICTLSACALVAAGKGGKASIAAFKYLMLCTVASGLVMFAIGLLYFITGYLSFAYVHDTLQIVWQSYPHVVYLSAVLFIVGMGIKSALFPLHVWLPDAHSSAPTTSSALLSGIAVKAYLVGLFKVFYLVFGRELLQALGMANLLWVLGVAGVIGASLFALVQKEVKRMLAYSTVAQLGYIFIGIGLNNNLGVAAAIFQIVSHACMKSAMFAIAGHFAEEGKTQVSDYAGVGKKQPVLFTAFTIFALSMIGIPLFSGFVTKWLLFRAALDAKHAGILLLIVLSGLLNAGYFLPLLWNGWFGGETGYAKPRFRFSQALPIVMAVVVLWLGIAPAPLLRLLDRTANLMLRW